MTDVKIVTIDLAKLPELPPLHERTEVLEVVVPEDDKRQYDKLAAELGDADLETLMARIMGAIVNGVEQLTDEERARAVLRFTIGETGGTD
ncbi:hypothetical protein G6321_00011890 [Bradyrhizobium barranii subsp. barranii]|uniref:Uncharacterized protein n=1 Tax=Bradyrhizobium barranii subsp. barranii TaxID=2823807 RepID=A0A7Z0TQ64_9BRAD|nr:hypothetical protein [Bradyrhizobium barranii]UGX95792.1 hypothetical protein G6321_00011890 [Bradyrhizobium barranii subsp. barranii]